jgi:hypothetical protein
MCIGQGVQAISDNACRIGNGSNTYVAPSSTASVDLGSANYRWKDVLITGSVISTSDRNAKKDIADSDMGLAFIEKLRPRKYKFKDIAEKKQNIKGADGETVEVLSQKAVKYKRTHYGLIAQEVKTVLGKADFAGYIDNSVGGDGKGYGLRYSEFIAPLIKAVQELSAKIKVLETA